MKFSRFGKYNLKTRLLIVTVLAVITASGLVGGLFYWNSVKVLKSTLSSRIAIQTNIIKHNVVAPLIFDDDSAAVEILESLQSDEAVISAVVLKNNGDKFASYRRSSDDVGDSPSGLVRYQQDIRFNDEVVGRIFIEVSTKEIFDQEREILVFLFLVMCVVLVVAIALLLPVVRSILDPLLNLHAVSEKIKETRDYTLRVDIETEDEIGKLSTMFNGMIEQVSRRDEMLEKEVNQRTDELKKLAEEFRHRAFHDSLTGLPNRALLVDRFDLSVQHALRNGIMFSCILIDLDDFKTINDTKGHEFGDKLLVEISRRLKLVVRGEDLVCRLGGDEFVIIINDLKDENHVNTVADKIIKAINQELTVNGDRIKISASVGGAIYPRHGEDLSVIKRSADVAMYKAKEQGKNKFCLYADWMQEDVKFRLIVQNDLKPGLLNGEFKVFLQPKVNAHENRVVGCEALIRWEHPVEGFLVPGKFVPFAEEVGLISDIDRYVISESCKFIANWKASGRPDLSIAINLSGLHFQDHEIVDTLKNSIMEHGIAPSSLEVEITEAVLIADPIKAHEVVSEIKKLGLRIALDDFGTGYSSLNYLRTLPIDTVKLDRSFISSVDKNDQDRRLTRGIVSLAKDLDLDMVAEGVETASQLASLLEIGCHVVQGYYFSPPTDFDNFIAWYEKEFNELKQSL